TARRSGAATPGRRRSPGVGCGRRRNARRRASRIAAAPTDADGRGRASLCGPARSSSEPLGEKIALDLQLSDLRVQPLDLALHLGFGILSDLRVERPRRMVLQLLLPDINLVRMHLIALRQVGYSRLLTQRFQRDLRL